MSERIPLEEDVAEARVRCSVVLTRERIAKLEAHEMRRRENPKGNAWYQKWYADLLRRALAEAFADLARMVVEPS